MRNLQALQTAGRQLCWLPLSSIHPNSRQPRTDFDEFALMELAASIRQNGLLQPVTVRPAAEGYELIMGERRCRACRLLGHTHIEAFVLPADDQESALLALVENVQRKNLHFFEEAEALSRLCGQGMAQDTLARMLGKSPSAINNRLRLLRLEPSVREVICEGQLTERHARALLSLPGEELRLRVARAAAAQHLSVQKTEQLIARTLEKLPMPLTCRRVVSLARDYRLYINAIRGIVGQLCDTGVQAQCEAKNHALVLEDCDLESTVNAIINSTYGCAGMRCMALPVIVVQESIADKFVALLREKAMAMKVGCAYDPETKLGPVVSAKHKKSICDWIQRGIDDGAELVLDGRDIVVPGYENGFFVGPTILDHVTPDMSIGQREIFGPVTLIKRVKTFEEGLAVMNANPFANGSAIFTQSGYYARQFEMLTDGGMVGINVGIPVPSAYFPFSGNKDSFFGDQHVLGLDGVRFYTRAKTVTMHWYDEHARRKAMDTWEGTVERI